MRFDSIVTASPSQALLGGYEKVIKSKIAVVLNTDVCATLKLITGGKRGLFVIGSYAIGSCAGLLARIFHGHDRLGGRRGLCPARARDWHVGVTVRLMSSG